jgi:glucosamine-6-phosphate deaminase
MAEPSRQLKVGHALVRIYPTGTAMSRAAAIRATAVLKRAISREGSARVIVGTGTSQKEFVRAMSAAPNLDWRAVELFHMDEYARMSASHPASFRRWLKSQLADIVHPGKVHYLHGDAADQDEECRRYGALLRAKPITLSCLGFGENGHLAFNDPHTADFDDPVSVKLVDLDRRCRMQQVGEGHFPDLGAVPRTAVTVTCPTLLSAEYVICCVPDRRKAEAVRDALEGPISPNCPASLVRTHPKTVIYLDEDSASMLRVRGAG